MAEVFGLVAPLFGLILIGYGVGKLVKMPLEGMQWMDLFIIYIALPAMFFKLLSGIRLDALLNVRFFVLTTSVTLIVFLIGFFIARWARREETGGAAIQGFAGAYGNIGYMGAPLVLSAFGPVAIGPAVLIICLDNTLHFILAPSFMAMRGQDRQNPLNLAGLIVWRIVSHPFILGTLAGLLAAAFQFKAPGPIDKVLTMLAAAAAPCALFAMGVTAALRPVKRVPVELGWLVPMKLVLHPALMWLVLTALGPFDPVFFKTAVLLAALPAATNVFVIARQYDVWVERASSAVVLSTLFAIVTVTGVLYMLK